MKLGELIKYNTITIQCHDNPDADALASGFGLYCFFKEKGNCVRLVYTGKNQIQKTNLTQMVSKLQIPIAFISPEPENLKTDGLLITVDCQYGAGNVTKIEAEAVAMIDHHQLESRDISLRRIHTNLGSCATLVWQMLSEEGYQVKENAALSTALYYGLYMDTKQFSEIYHPLDMDMREELPYNKSLITQFKNSNLTLQELEIAGIAMLRYSYNNDNRFAVIKAKPCDPNILGLISDLVMQVDEIDVCVVYNEINDGFKLSVRSCIKEVNANELAFYLTEGVGSGGGHLEKAGGFISIKLYEAKYPTIHSEAYFNSRMTDYFDSYEIMDTDECVIDTAGMKLYRQKRMPLAYRKADDMFAAGTPVTVRTSQGDRDYVIRENQYIVMGKHGELNSYNTEEFMQLFQVTEEQYHISDHESPEYLPTIKNRTNGHLTDFVNNAKVCIPANEDLYFSRILDKGIKIFSKWDKQHYIVGRPGDYLIVDREEQKAAGVVRAEDFEKEFVRV